LILKLNRFGIRGLPLQFLKSYLTNRKQFTKVNGCESDCYNIKCGVPQGSTLGPLLFSIYINDLLLDTKFNTKLFADDAVLTMSHQLLPALNININKEFQK